MDLVKEISNLKGTEVEFLVRKGGSNLGILGSPEFTSSEYVYITPRKNPPSLKVVNEVTIPDQEIELRQAQRYNPSLKIGDTLQQGSLGVLIGTSNGKIIKDRLPLHQSILTAFSNCLLYTSDAADE